MEACEAAKNSVDILFIIDNGDQNDIHSVSICLNRTGQKDAIKLAFAYSIGLADMDNIKTSDVDIPDIERWVIGAPLSDMKMEVLDTLP